VGAAVVANPTSAATSDFWLFIWPFIILVNATRVLLAKAPQRDSVTLDEEPGLA